MVVLPLPPLKLTTVTTWRCSDAVRQGRYFRSPLLLASR